MNERLLILGADTSAKDAIAYARSKGIQTIVTDYNPPELVEEKRLADDYWMINVADLDALEQRCREEGITGIYAGNSEFCIDQCKALCERLGLPFYASEKGWKAARDKSFFKEVCAGCGVTTPRRYLLAHDFTLEDVKDIVFPVLVKPADSCAQQGLSVVSTPKELRAAYDMALNFSSKKDIIVEDYVNGDEINLFCFLHDGELTLLGLSEDMMSTDINGRKHFGFGLQFTQYDDFIHSELLPRLQKVADAMDCRNGCCLFQGIMRGGVFYALEFGYRLDGIRSWRHAKRSCGISQLECMVDLALGHSLDDRDWGLSVYHAHKEISITYVMWCRPGKIEKITGMKELSENEDIVFLLDRFQEGDVVPAGDNMRAIAFDIGIFGKDNEDLDRKVKAVNSLLHFYDASGEDLLVHIDDFYKQWKAYTGFCD